jgi:hypothetical protein
MGPLLLALLAAPPAAPFDFTGVTAWKWSEGRQERIPALAATLDNRSGEDWESVRIRVVVACDSGERSYTVALRMIEPGLQKVEAVAFDAIGAVQPCDGAARVEFIDGVRVPRDRRYSYLVLGFAFEAGDGEPSRDLEGILDHRATADGKTETKRDYWNGAGEFLGSRDGFGWYAFKVEPGDLGLAGFLLNRDPQSNGPLDRFLRFYSVPPDSAAFIGAFQVRRGPGQMVGVTMEKASATYERLRAEFPQLRARAWTLSEPRKPKVQGILSVDR